MPPFISLLPDCRCSVSRCLTLSPHLPYLDAAYSFKPRFCMHLLSSCFHQVLCHSTEKISQYSQFVKSPSYQNFDHSGISPLILENSSSEKHLDVLRDMLLACSWLSCCLLVQKCVPSVRLQCWLDGLDTRSPCHAS